MSEIIRTPAEWKASLLDNVADVTLGQLEFTSPSDCVDISTYTGSPGYTIRGTGGNWTWGAGVIYRLFHEPNPHDPTPLVKFPRGRHWELRVPDGLILAGMRHRGIMLQVEYAQQSRYVDMRVEGCGDHSSEPQFPPVIINGGTSTFDFLQTFWNRLPCRITGAGVTKIRDYQSVCQWSSPLTAGLHIIAAPHEPPPIGNSLAVKLDVEDPHLEGSPLIIEGFDHAATLKGGYYLTAQVHWNKCRHIRADLTPYNSAWWGASTMYRDGKMIRDHTGRWL